MKRVFTMDNAVYECIEKREDFVRLECQFGPHLLISILKGEDAWDHIRRNPEASDYLSGVLVGDDYYINHVGAYVVKIPAVEEFTPDLLEACLRENGIAVERR